MQEHSDIEKARLAIALYEEANGLLSPFEFGAKLARESVEKFFSNE